MKKMELPYKDDARLYDILGAPSPEIQLNRYNINANILLCRAIRQLETRLEKVEGKQ